MVSAEDYEKYKAIAQELEKLAEKQGKKILHEAANLDPRTYDKWVAGNASFDRIDTETDEIGYSRYASGNEDYTGIPVRFLWEDDWREQVLAARAERERKEAEIAAEEKRQQQEEIARQRKEQAEKDELAEYRRLKRKYEKGKKE